MKYHPSALLLAAFALACDAKDHGADPETRSASPSPVGAHVTSEPPQLFAGDPLPEPVLAGARHWQRGGAAGGRVLVLSFSYTRCASGACTEVERKLLALQREVRANPDLIGSIGILSLSVDPAHDIPAVLRSHADRVGAHADTWRFAALPASHLDDVLARFGIARSATRDGAPIGQHNEVVALVDAGGALVKTYRGSGWTPDDLLIDLRGLVLRADPEMLAAYVAAQEALAADDLRTARPALRRLARVVTDPAVAKLAQSAANARDLHATRSALKPLSEALGRLSLPPGYQLIYCPMFDRNSGLPRASASESRGATWIQKAGPVANPYFGRAMLNCGIDQSPGAHADHSPQHGGILFMAADAFHHLEATYTNDGIVRVHISDNYKRPMDVSRFLGRVVLKEEFDERRQGVRELIVHPLTRSRDRMVLEARVGALKFPAEFTVKIAFSLAGPEERFDFVFGDYGR